MSRIQLNEDERYLLQFYTQLHNQTSQRIESLYHNLEQIQEVIDFISHVPQHVRRSRVSSGRVRNNATANANATANMGMNFNFTNTNTTTTTNTSTTRTNPFTFYDNVIVAPTQETIQHATRRILFSQIENPINQSCPISLEIFEPTMEVMEIVYCHHLFNPMNLLSWFQTSVRCPICRYDIRSQSLDEQLNDSVESSSLLLDSLNHILQPFFEQIDADASHNVIYFATTTSTSSS
jgi:hypothetical protein